MKRRLACLSLLAMVSPAYAEVADKVPGVWRMGLCPLGVVMLLAVGAAMKWRALAGIAFLLSVLFSWGWWEFVFIDDIYPAAVQELGAGYAVAAHGQLVLWGVLTALSGWLLIKRR